jgi:hypothetical protein
MQDYLITSIPLLILFFLGYLERKISNRRNRTLEFLLKVIENDGPIHTAHLRSALWVCEGRIFEDDNVSFDEDETIIRLLDYYDLIADTAMKKVIDKEMVILHLGGRMRTTYVLFSKYISQRRLRLSRDGLYKHLENFITNEIADKKI